MNAIRDSGFFSDDERDGFETVIEDIIKDKLGVRAGSILLHNLEHSKDKAKPHEIFTGTADTIPEAAVKKVQAMSIMAQQILVKSAINYLSSPQMVRPLFYSIYRGTNVPTEKIAKFKETSAHLKNQVTDFVNRVMADSPINQINFVRLFFVTNPQLDDEMMKRRKYTNYNDKTVLATMYTGTKFSKNILETIRGLNKAVDD